MWKDAVAVAFQALARLLPGQTEVHHKNSHSECTLSSNRHLPWVAGTVAAWHCLQPDTIQDDGSWTPKPTSPMICTMNFLFMPQVAPWPAGRQQTCIYKQGLPSATRQPLSEMWEPLFPTTTARLRDRFRVTYGTCLIQRLGRTRRI